MPTHQDLDNMIALVDQERFLEAIERYYAVHVRVQENFGATRESRDAVLAHEKGVMAAFKTTRAKSIGPFFISGEYAVVRWSFEFDDGKGNTISLDELAYQRWEDGKIVEERFYYDPGQMVPKPRESASH